MLRVALCIQGLSARPAFSTSQPAEKINNPLIGIEGLCGRIFVTRRMTFHQETPEEIKENLTKNVKYNTKQGSRVSCSLILV